ncbi:MAG: rhamnogalacturonan acetylesterase [Chthoniobacteraceae bacterium]
MISKFAFRGRCATVAIVSVLLSGLLPLAHGAVGETSFQFAFGAKGPVSGFTTVGQSALYDSGVGYGYLDASAVEDVDRGGPNPVQSHFCTSGKPFIFAVDVPEGNYKVTVTLGDRAGVSQTAVKASSRELALETVETKQGQVGQYSFTVNVKTPTFDGGRQVGLKKREMELRRWDGRILLEFCGNRPCVDAVQIEKANAVTVFLAGDSTVTSQQNEPWAGWGQMLGRFFTPSVAVANHAESGLALYSFRGGRRLDKILASMHPGDYVFVQFGHNDQKDKTPGAGPFTTYKENLKQYVTAVRDKGGNPVLVSPMERRRWDADGKPLSTLHDYAEAVSQVHEEEHVPMIDLNAMSLKFYEALGPEGSKKAFVHYPAGTFPGQDKELKDNTHHNVYGAYELAKCVVRGIRENVPDLAKLLRNDVPPFEPSNPDKEESLHIPPSGNSSIEKPAGS